MATFHAPLFLLLLLPPLFFHHPSATQDSTALLIHKTCSKTDYYDVCVASLESDPRSSTADINIFAKIFIELALSNATDTYSYTYELTQAPINDDILEMCLNDCLVFYDIGINDLKQGLTYHDLKEFIQVKKLVGDAQVQGEKCDQVFQKPPVPKSPSPLTKRNDAFEQFCSIAMAIVNILV